MKLYTVADSVRMMGWPAKGKYYQRVHGACGMGAAGRVMRINRGYILTAANMRRLAAWLRRRWPEDPPPSDPMPVPGEVDVNEVVVIVQ
jgi:hypothetical protein